MAKRVMRADLTTLRPGEELTPTTWLEFQSTACEGDEPEHHRVELEMVTRDLGRLVWVERPGTPSEFRFVVADHVSPLLEGEELNGLDDNGNGLVDEPGLTFVLFRFAVTIRLSVEAPTPGGLVRETLETTVTCARAPRLAVDTSR